MAPLLGAPEARGPGSLNRLNPGSYATDQNVSILWLLLEIRMTDVASGDNRSYKTYKAPVQMSPPTNQHPDDLNLNII